MKKSYPKVMIEYTTNRNRSLPGLICSFLHATIEFRQHFMAYSSERDVHLGQYANYEATHLLYFIDLSILDIKHL
jgi:hypothetical protein